MPKTFLMLVLAVGILLFVKEYLQNRRLQATGKTSEPLPYPFSRQSAFFSIAEGKLLRKLSRAAGEDHLVFGKVRLADMVSVGPELNAAETETLRDEIKALSVDFVICRRSNLTISGAVLIEKNKQDGKQADWNRARIKGALEAAGIPLLHLSPKKNYTTATLRSRMRQAASTAAADPETQSASQARRRTATAGQDSASASLLEVCPTCGTKLVRRRVSGGHMDGNQVLVCRNYPSCKHILPLSVQAAPSG